MVYTVVLVRDAGGGYTVRVPALRGCITEGDDRTQALRNAQEAISVYLESLEDDGIAFPADKPVIELYEHEEEALAIRLALEEAPAVA